MKKETILAVVLGVGLGVVVSVGLVMRSRQVQIKNSKPITSTLSVTPTPLAKNISTEALEIIELQDGTITDTNSINIKGKVAKGSLIIIQSPIKTQIIKDAPEKLDIKFPLALGENAIHITAYPSDSQLSPQEKELQIYYLDEN